MGEQSALKEGALGSNTEALRLSPVSNDELLYRTGVKKPEPKPLKINPLDTLTADTGYTIIGPAARDQKPLTPVEGHPGYATLRDMLGRTQGRAADWRLIEHISSAKERNWPGVKPNEFPNGEIAICGGGASLNKPENLRALRKLQKKGVKVLAVNRTHDYLLSKHIPVWAGVLLDAIPHVKNYMTPRKCVRYYIASQCHPDTHETFNRPELTKYTWHARASGAEVEVLTPEELNNAIASRTSTVGLRSVILAYRMGFRKIHMFGFDSSYDTDMVHAAMRRTSPPELFNADGTLKDEEFEPDTENRNGFRPKPGQMKQTTAYFLTAVGNLMKAVTEGQESISLHAYLKPETVHDMRKVSLVIPERGPTTFYTNSAMAAQADEFKDLVMDISKAIRDGFMDVVFMYVHGDGLIPTIASFFGLHVKKARNNG